MTRPGRRHRSRFEQELFTSIPAIPLSQALALSFDAAFAVDEQFRVQCANPAAERLFAYDLGRIAGQDVRTLVTQGLFGEWPAVKATGSESGEDAIVYRAALCRTQNGHEFAAELRCRSIETGAQRLLLVAIRDLSGTQPVGETSISGWQSEALYRSVVAAMQDGIVVQGAAGHILALNSSAERILGLTTDQLEGLTSVDPRWRAVHPDGTPFPGEHHPAMVTLRTGEPLFHVPMGIHHPDGTLVWLSVNSQPLIAPGSSRPYAVVTSFADVTQARAAEQALLDQERLLRAVVENMPVGVWIMDKTGKIVLGNMAGKRIWAGARYVGPDQFGEYKAWWYPSGLPIAADEWAAARAIAKGETSIDELIEIECFDGTHKIVLNSALPVLDADGQVAGGIIVNQDITERMAAFQLAEQRVIERTREIEALLQVGREMAATLKLQPLLHTILTQLQVLVDYSGAAIGIVEGGELRIAEYVGPVPREQMVNQRYRLDGQHPYGQVVAERRPVILTDMWAVTPWLNDPVHKVDDELMRQFENTHSWMGVPLIIGDDLFGVLRIDHPSIGFYTEEHERIVSAFAAHAAVVIQNAQLYEQSQRTAALEERQRLARELHDSVSQALYGIALGARTAQRLLERGVSEVEKPLQYVLTLAEAAFAEMRALIFELRPDSLETDGLIAALDRQVDALSARHHIMVEADLCEEPQTSVSVKEAIYRIVQEAAQNAVKHAHASRIDICLTTTAHEELLLEVVDDGQGFDPENVPPGHLGLRGMRERTEAAGGAFEIESAPGEGTRITARVPLRPAS